MFRSARSPIPSTPILPARSGNLRATLSTRKRSLPSSMSPAASRLGLLARLRFSSWRRTPWAPMRGMNLAFQRRPQPARCRLPGIGGDVYGRRGGAARACSDLAVKSFAARGRRWLIVVFGTSRNDRSQGWRSRHPQADNPSDVLGCPCDGADHRNRCSIRQGRLNVCALAEGIDGRSIGGDHEIHVKMTGAAQVRRQQQARAGRENERRA